MALYEKRTYSLVVGKMPEAIEHYAKVGFPAIRAGGFDKHLVGYFISDTGPLHQIIHLWRFDDDAARRDFWARLFADEGFKTFGPLIRPLIIGQDVQLLTPAPWGPQP